MASRAFAYRPISAVLEEQRREPRYQVQVTRATVRKNAHQPVIAVLRDLSIYGCRLEAGEGFAGGTRIWVRLDGATPVAAQVVWSDAGMIGCRFDEPITRAQLRTMTLALA